MAPTVTLAVHVGPLTVSATYDVPAEPDRVAAVVHDRTLRLLSSALGVHVGGTTGRDDDATAGWEGAARPPTPAPAMDPGRGGDRDTEGDA